jgi:hypothetical protein
VLPRLQLCTSKLRPPWLATDHPRKRQSLWTWTADTLRGRTNTHTTRITLQQSLVCPSRRTDRVARAGVRRRGIVAMPDQVPHRRTTPADQVQRMPLTAECRMGTLALRIPRQCRRIPPRTLRSDRLLRPTLCNPRFLHPQSPPSLLRRPSRRSVDRPIYCIVILSLAKARMDKSASHPEANPRVTRQVVLASERSMPASASCCGMIPSTLPNCRRKSMF